MDLHPSLKHEMSLSESSSHEKTLKGRKDIKRVILTDLWDDVKCNTIKTVCPSDPQSLLMQLGGN